MSRSIPSSWDEKALEVARRFTQDTEPQRRASLQCAVLDAMQWVAPEARAGDCDAVHAALCFLGELELSGNKKAGEIASNLRRLTTKATP